jgi:hypothetical protein
MEVEFLSLPRVALLHSVTCVQLRLITILGNRGCVVLASILGVSSASCHTTKWFHHFLMPRSILVMMGRQCLTAVIRCWPSPAQSFSVSGKKKKRTIYIFFFEISLPTNSGHLPTGVKQPKREASPLKPHAHQTACGRLQFRRLTSTRSHNTSRADADCCR